MTSSMNSTNGRAAESFQDVSDNDGGITEDLLYYIQSCFDECSLMAQGRALEHEVWELKRKFKLWKEGEQKLDQRLARNPDVRRALFRMILLPLIWELNQGLPFYRASTKETLRKEADRIMEQAASLARYVPPSQGEHDSPKHATEFINAGYQSFKSHLDSLYEFSPTINPSFENNDSPNTQRGQKRSCDEIKPHVVVAVASKLRASFARGINPSKRQKNRLLDVEDVRSGPGLADFSSRHYSDSAASSNVPAFFSQDGNNSGRKPMTDTITSITSAQESHGDTEPLAPFQHLQRIMVQDCSSRNEAPHIGLFDSGTSDCFIVRDAANQLNLQIHRLPNEETYKLLDGREVQVSEYVEPDWRLYQGRKRHQKDKFFLVDALPDGIHMLIGPATYQKMGINFHAKKSALVAFLTRGKGSSKVGIQEEQLSRARQVRDDDTHWNQTQKTLKEDHATTGKSTSSGKPRYRALHKEEIGTAQVKQKVVSWYKQGASSANKNQ